MRKIEKRGLLSRDGCLPIALLLGVLAPCDIADDGQRERRPIETQGTEHDIDREFAAILTFAK